MKSRKWKWAIISIAVIAVAGVFGVAAVRYFAGRTEAADGPSAVPVVTGYARRRAVEELLRYPGTLLSCETVTVVPKIAGAVDDVAVRVGDSVRPGSVLLQLEAESAELQAEQALSAWNAADAQLRKAERGVREAELENAQADLSQAEENFSVAEKNLDRSKRLYEGGAIAKAAFEDAENRLNSARTALENARRSVGMMEEGASSEELEMAKANEEAAKAVYELAKLQLDYAKVSSPVSGIVAKVFVDEGNLVGTGTPLLAIVQEDPIEVCVRVPEKYYADFGKAGTSLGLRVFPIAYAGRPPFEGAVTTVAPVIDPASRTFEVCGELPNPEGLLKPGMYVNAELVIGNEEELFMVPDTAVVLRDERPVIFIVRGGDTSTALEVAVTTGKKSSGYTEIAGEITEGDELVILGNAFLEDGQAVEVVERR